MTVSLFDVAVGIFRVCAIFDLDLDAVEDLGVKQLACELHLLLGIFIFIIIDLPSGVAIGGGHQNSLSIIWFISIVRC